MTRLGLRENISQFSLLVLINAFVGAMVGLERSIIPEIAEVDFGIAAKTAILSFIVVFGISKAITNYYTGILADKYGRKLLLIFGWLIAIPIPIILIYANNWNWIIAANILLGINQGLCWSSTVVMKIDLVGPKQRGLAMGLNESAGYLSVGIIAYFSAIIASEYGFRPYPFYLGMIFVLLGLVLSLFFVKETKHHVISESQISSIPKLKNIFLETSWLNRNLGSISQAGLVNNLNDGMVWGLLPILLSSEGFNLNQIGIIVAIYPAVWGIGQLFTGPLADKFVKKRMLVFGMLMQGIALLAMVLANDILEYSLLCIILGIGTAIVYPTFLAAISEYTHPQQRASSIGVFRLWRDLGYAIGALLTGIITDIFGLNWAIISIALLTIISSGILQFRMRSSQLSN